MEALGIKTGTTAAHWEDNTSCIYFVEYKIVTTKLKHIDIPVCFLQYFFYNGLFIPRYEKSSVMPIDMCNKACSGSIISHSTKCMTGFRFYPTSDT